VKKYLPNLNLPPHEAAAYAYCVSHFLDQFSLPETPVLHEVSLDYGRDTITGFVSLRPVSGQVSVRCLEWPSRLTGEAAEGALRSAVADGRCKVPDDIRAAIDSGAKVL
jgi:hypothetical protein